MLLSNLQYQINVKSVIGFLKASTPVHTTLASGRRTTSEYN
jgi:hypothetical protein